MSPTFRPLNGRLCWPTGRRTRISVSRAGLQLEADPRGPLSIAWIDGSLGGLTLPRGFALDPDGTLYLLDPPARSDSDVSRPHRRPAQRVRRYDPYGQRFVPLPALGRWGSDAREFREASNISATTDGLFIADAGNRRVQVVSPGTLHLLHVWSLPGSTADGPPHLDVTSHGDTTYILDGLSGRVLRHRSGEDAPVLFVHVQRRARTWSRIAADREGRVYLLDAGRKLLDVYAPEGKWLQVVTDAGDVRDRFPPPAVALVFDARRVDPGADTGHFWFPKRPASPSRGELPFDRRGRRVRVSQADLVEPTLYAREGTWISTALDSGIHACQWHRLQVELPSIPSGCHVVISTYTSDVDTSRPHEGAPLWQPALKAWGTAQPATPRPQDLDALVQSREGQFLWLSVRLEGDGFGSPEVASIEVHFPRDSYIRYLPAIYAADDDSRWFLERFLSIVQAEWDGIEQQVRDMARYFDIDAAPAEGGWLELLASWVAVPLEQAWTAGQKRNLLRVAARLLGRRGTKSGLQAFVQAYVQNMTGVPPESQGSWPQILEAFRERHRLVLSSSPGALGSNAVLWSASVVGRPQLDVFGEADSVRLVSTGDPARDVFHQYSHRFTIVVPAAWVRTDEDERMLRRAIDAEKPAHTSYDLRLIEPRFRVGVQSTVGIDTIVGGCPAARVGGTATSAPGRPPRNRLGYDTVLGGRAPRPAGVRLSDSRIGLDTILD